MLHPRAGSKLLSSRIRRQRSPRDASASGGTRSCSLLSAAFFAHRFAFQLDAMCIMDQAVEDAVGRGRVADLRMPVGHRRLRGQNSGTGLIAVVADLQKISAFGVAQ